jgi:TPR repeat protein
MMYLSGRGVPEDQLEGVRLLQIAAIHGVPDAHLKLGNIFFLGEVVDRNVEDAILYYQEAAESGNQDAQMALGTIYLNGHGVDKNIEKSIEWLNQAAEQGDVIALGTSDRIANQRAALPHLSLQIAGRTSQRPL